ncbi:MAG: PHP domain-containing protein [Planctomycetaceae bacterium]|nr:PHP domain-containing protein [Planctomycetaceae bacterium]
MPHYICDLHLHTDRSDGSSTPKELVDDAAAMGMAVISITDHDVRPPTTVSTDSGEQDIVHYAASKNLHLIRGIEISCETEVEDTHIVGFGCDWQNPFLVCSKLRCLNQK